MPNVTGIVKQFYPNNGKPAVMLDDGNRYGAFKADQMEGVQQGSVVSFAYEQSQTNGKTYNNVKGKVAIVAAQAAMTNTPNPSAASPQQANTTGHRNGQQVGASINQAIAALPVLGTEPTLDNLEHLAQAFLLMGDRLAQYKG